MNKLGLLITVMLVVTALYFLVTNMFTPPKPQVVVVRPSGAQSVNQPANQSTSPSVVPVSAGGLYVCPKNVLLRVGGVTLCADTLYNVIKGDGGIQVDFQDGIIQGNFIFVSAPTCSVATTPQGALFIPCRAVIMIQTK